MTTERERFIREFKARVKARGPLAVPTGTKEKPPQPKRPSILEFAKTGGLPGAKKAQETPPLKKAVEEGHLPSLKLPPKIEEAATTASMLVPVLAGVKAGGELGKVAAKVIRKKPTTKPVASEALSPAAKAAQATISTNIPTNDDIIRRLKVGYPQAQKIRGEILAGRTTLDAEITANSRRLADFGRTTPQTEIPPTHIGFSEKNLSPEDLFEYRGLKEKIADRNALIKQIDEAPGVISSVRQRRKLLLQRQNQASIEEIAAIESAQVAPVGARRTPQVVTEAKALTEPEIAPTGAPAVAEAMAGKKAAAGLNIPEGFVLEAVLPFQKGVQFVNPTTGEKRIVTGLSSAAIKEARIKLSISKTPAPVSAAPPAKPPVIRRITQPEPGFSVIGVDSQGRKVRAVAPTLKEAQAIRANILAGREPFAGAEVQFQQKAVANAERRMKAAIKRGDKGAEQRADVELHELYSTGGKLPPKPPKPPTTGPDGTSVPPPSFEGARDKLVKILQTSVRRSNKELESLRAAERKRRAGMVEAGFQRATAAGEPPIARIRAAQRGEFPAPELELADRLLPEEVSVLRGSIYDTLGPELRQTAANVDEALTRLATEGKLPTPSEIAWMEEIFGPEFVKALLEHRTRGAKALELALGVWNLPRALLASFDDSMVLRQGLYLLPEGAPAGSALKAHIKAITSAGAEEVNAGIRANPWFNHGRARGLDLSLPGVARGLVGREEVFMGAGIAAKIPILGRGIRVSERVAEAYLNKLRMETYAAHAQELTRMGASDAAFRELAQNIGILSGRASLGKAQAIAPVLNGLFFSARLNWARAQAPIRILRQVPNLGTPEGRHLAKMLAKDVYGVWAGVAGMLGVAAAAGAAVELDPRSSDFGKIQIGTVRVDPWAGQQQFAVLMARLVSGEVKTTTTRTVRPQEEMDTLARFIESKFHPALGQLIAVKRGKTYVGEELTVNEYAKQWLPLFVQDIQEITTGTTPGMAAALGTAAFFGVSVYNVPGVPASVVNQIEDAVNQYMAIPADSLELTTGQISRQKFRERNPNVDAALFIAGQVTSLTSSQAIKEAAKLIKEHGINADDIRGIDQRKERLEQARLAGKKLEKTEVDTLIRILEQGSAAPAPRNQPTPTPSGTPTFRGLDRLRELEPAR